MNRTRTLAVALVLVAALLAVGTGSYRSVAADRGVNLQVAEEGNGMLDLTVQDPSLQNTSGDRTLVTIENQFGTQITVAEPEIDGGSGDLPVLDNVELSGSGTIQTGGSTTVVAHIDCDGSGGELPTSETRSVTIRATGDGISVETAVEVDIECTK
jgi:hypothetical protein